jgi:hypothetical protein
MPRRVSFFVLLTLMIVTTGAVHAVPRPAGPKPVSESAGVLDRLWGWLSGLFLPTGPASGGSTSTWGTEGSHLDPNGQH